MFEKAIVAFRKEDVEDLLESVKLTLRFALDGVHLAVLPDSD